MTYEQIKAAVLALPRDDQYRLTWDLDEKLGSYTLCSLVARAAHAAARAAVVRRPGRVTAMSYSCSDFVDTVLDALNIVVPEADCDDPSAQTDLALAAIARLEVKPTAATKRLVAALGTLLAEYAEIDEMLDSFAAACPEGMTADEKRRQRRSNRARNRVQRTYANAVEQGG